MVLIDEWREACACPGAARARLRQDELDREDAALGIGSPERFRLVVDARRSIGTGRTMSRGEYRAALEAAFEERGIRPASTELDFHSLNRGRNDDRGYLTTPRLRAVLTEWGGGWVKVAADVLADQRQARLDQAETPTDLSDDDLYDLAWERLTEPSDAWSEPWLQAYPPVVRAFIGTGHFESEVGNGGLEQYFFNCEDEPWLLEAALDGYDLLGLSDVRQVIVDRVLPVAMADDEKARRERERRHPGDGWGPSALDDLDDLIDDHTDLRVALIRSDPSAFGLGEASPRPG